MEIRLLSKSDDKLAVSHVYEQSWKSAYKGLIPQEYLESIPEGRWIPMLQSPSRYTLVMLDGEKIVGTSSFSSSRFPDMAGYGELISIYLLPEYTGRGLGRSLFKAALDMLFSQGFEKIFLWVLEGNSRAIGFYESFGFKPSGKILNDEIGGKPLRELQYIFDKALEK